jgi:hypothetical protein
MQLQPLLEYPLLLINLPRAVYAAVYPCVYPSGGGARAQYYIPIVIPAGYYIDTTAWPPLIMPLMEGNVPQPVFLFHGLRLLNIDTCSTIMPGAK